ncbi:MULTISPECIES: hypothetical protein [Pseudoalteromonas]|uniref:Lipocalin-like domain-containing protein n=1 Tax=Pseudoalteromonas luteoviolacea (strain 2ta16) TaxID=1353533 RepID=V4HWZ9_PSEL2|nr:MULTISPECIES: hypothetical protein [Pseudoalteromonas]ESP92484.1 hypothetical protein PL2TA16_04293 [Pseudoalteromonas luteoviolacea 2ta16]KZN35043.1 hypothetical protein N483_24180 [Pseudoalteromonas luteoviolacea NCIMB 1944]MCG7550664.1 hypothetical protein [Pseudoalteromonas sp. Of7M-16]
MKSLPIIVVVVLSGCVHTNYTQLSLAQRLVGTWYYSDRGTNHHDRKSCLFKESGKVECDVEEGNFFANGFGEAHFHKTTGSWHIYKTQLTVIEAPTYSPNNVHTWKMKVDKLTQNQMILLNEQAYREVWQKVTD